jgi:predicted TIM-barrel fold metal-dependent hydrolase
VSASLNIDTHVHVMLAPFYGRPATDPARLLGDLASCGLDGCWVSAIEGMITRDLSVQRQSNDRLAELAAKHPGRIEGFCTVDPSAMDQAAREVRRCVKKLGLIGVKLHPWLQAFSVTHPGMDLVMSAAAEMKVPVMFHDGTPPYSTPRQIAWLAAKHPRTQVILGHSGLADFWRDASDVGRLLPNVWLQPTCSPPIAVRAALEAVGPGRLLFGTDGGFGTVNFIRYSTARYRSALGDDLLRTVMRDSPRKLKERLENPC